MKKISHHEFIAECEAQFPGEVVLPRHWAFVCPLCGTIQSGESLMRASVTKEKLGSVVAFSCVGRSTGAGEHKRKEKPGRGCNYTLGGLLKLHSLVVVMGDGRELPSFEPATPTQAQELHRLLQSDPNAITARCRRSPDGEFSFSKE